MGEERDYAGLSSSQQNIWNLEQAYPGLPLNNICTSLYIEGNFRVDLLQKCIELAYVAYPVLRTRITRKEGKILQYTAQEIPAPAPFIDFSRTNQSGVSVWNQSVAREHMPLYDSCLCQMTIFKLSEEQGGILTRVHHIIADAWSQATVTNHIIHNYFRLLQEEEPVSEVTPDYRDHIRAEQTYLESAAFGRDCAFWHEKLRNIPVTRLREHYYARVSPVGVRYSVHLPDRMNRMIAAFCERKKVSPFAVFYMGIVIYLARMKNQSRSCIGVPVINRMNYKEKQSGGMFVSTLPFVNELDTCLSLNEFNEKLKNDWFQLLYHQRIPFEEIKRILAAENEQVPEQLFGIALSYQNGKMDHLRGARVRMEGRWIYSGYQAESLCIHVSSRDVQNQFLVDYDYLTQIFSEEDIVRFHGHLMQILKEALLHPDLPVRDLNLISEEEEERLIFTFNHTEHWYQREHSLRQELQERAEEFPDRAALIWRGQRTTYRELLQEARELGERLAALCPGGEKNIALLLEPGADLFLWMCAVTWSGNAWVLLDRELPAGRIRLMLEESEAALCISEEAQGESLLPCRIMSKKEVLETSPCPEEELPVPGADWRAYLVYTSGSTGTPKAVETVQRSLVNLAENMREIYPKGAVLSLCSVGFDAFILESMCALLCGRTIVVLPGEDRNRPEAIAEAILRYDAGFLALTPSRLQAYLQNPLFGKAAGKLECIVCGGETLSGELLSAVRDVSGANLYNQYGPSEATVAVSHARITGEERFTIGKPFWNCRIYILDDKLRPLAPGCAGELYIGGDCLARGYFRDEEKTKERFISDPYVPGERLYRTGDMGEWTPDGRIVFLGRKDRQMKLLGHRIEPGEVEERLLAYPGVRQVAVTALGNQLAAYYTAEKEIDPEELLNYGADYLPRYMLPVYARQLERIPSTPGGKVDYGALPAPETGAESDQPLDDTEEKILEIWKRILGREQLGTGSDYFLSGGDSLNAVNMLTELEKTFGKKLRLEEVYRHSTVRKLAVLIRGKEVEKDRLEKAPARTVWPLSPSQESFYILEQSDETGKGYHMAGAFRVQGDLEEGRLEKAFARLTEEEVLLRTGFEAGADALQARIHESAEFHLEHPAGKTVGEALAAFVRPFDLACPPLLRAGMVQCQGETWLLMDMHHIISDGISSELILKRLDGYYRGDSPKVPAWHYFDYIWNLEKERKEGLPSYWEQTLETGIPELMLPLDRPRGPVFDGAGGRVYFALPGDLQQKIQEYCLQNRETLFTFLFTAWALLLSGVSGQSRFAVGVPLAGRRRQEFQETVGAFVNTLPVTVDFSGEKTVETCLEQTGRTVREVIDSQEVSVTELARKTGIRPSRDKNPLYCTLFSLAPLNADQFTLGEARLEFVPQDTGAVKVDLHLEVTPVQDGYRLCVEYASSLYDRETAAYYSRCYLQVLRQMLERPGSCLAPLDMVAPADRLRLLEEPSWVRTPYEAVCLDVLTDRYGLWKAEETAVTWGAGESMTYGNLLERAGEVAEALKERGVSRGDVVAFLPRRDGQMLVTMLAILKAGAAYLPLDAAFPPERIRYMLETAKASCLIVRENMAFSWEGEGTWRCPVFRLEELHSENFPAPVPGRSPEDVANVIFTSGSTGRPKGVMMVHRSLSNLLCHAGELLGTEEDCILCASSCVFDVFTTETLLALGRGRRISIADEEEMRFPAKMAERIQKDGATILQLTPSRMRLGLGDEAFCRALGQIRILILMGEPWTQKLKERIRELTEAKIYNIYGPTETSVYNCQGEIRDVNGIHIGKPIGNCRYYLLDGNRKQVMPTAEGEIYIAGECLAKGYIGRDDLTREVFVDDPFFPGQKMYKTGDRGRLRADGCWQCLGRTDTQLKLNGHRIEPEEIASQLMESGLVSEAAVVPVRGDGVPQYLCAFVAGGEAGCKERLFSWLAGRLPDYMVPSDIRLLDALPKTASGKTDLQRLEEEAQEETQEEIPSETTAEVPESGQAEGPGLGESERPDSGEPEELLPVLKNIWRQVLKREPREEVSFFEQGGTSLKAILVLNQYYARHLDLSLNDFYHAPTLKEQCAMLEPEQSGKDGTPQPESGQTEETGTPTFPAESIPFPVKGKTVLLTGATGYLGAHLLRELLQMGAGKIICLIRNVSDMRLRETLNAYFGGTFYLENWSRIETVTGDMTKERAGLPERAWEELARRSGLVVHCAADVRHYAPEQELYEANVRGTRNMLALAKKGGCPFVHISTVSVAGSRLREHPLERAVFTEDCLDAGQNWQENSYGKTKMLAEMEVARAAAEGLPVKVFRIGRLTARQKDGVFQRNPDTNAFYRLAKGLLEFGLLPETLSAEPFELTPVDLAAEAVGRLLSSGRCVFHILNSRRIPLGRLLNACTEMKSVTAEEFDEKLRRAVQGPCSDWLRAVAEMWISRDGMTGNMEVRSDQTEAELKKAGFVWCEPDVEQMKKCLEGERR